MSANFKLIYRPEESKWRLVKMPNENDFKIDLWTSDRDGIDRYKYDRVLAKAISEAILIAPQDQEKVNIKMYERVVAREGQKIRLKDFKPDPSKLYDSGDLEFEPAFINSDLDEVWVLKSKVEEKAKEKEETAIYLRGYFTKKELREMGEEQPKEEKKECNCTGPWDCQCPDILKSFYGLREEDSGVKEEPMKETQSALAKAWDEGFTALWNFRENNPEYSMLPKNPYKQ